MEGQKALFKKITEKNTLNYFSYLKIIQNIQV